MNTPQNIPSAPPQAAGSGVASSDELIALIKAARLMWKNRKRVAIGTGAFTLPGIVYALLATPVYVSEAAGAGVQGG